MATNHEIPPCPPLTGLILAGGAGQRVDGEDKAWLPWQGQSLFEHTLARLAPQTVTIWVSANRHLDRYQPWLDNGSIAAVVPDAWPGTPGPMAGLASALPRLRDATPARDWVLITPVDTPCLPPTLGEHLWQGLRQASPTAKLAVAWSSDQTHWLHMLMHKDLIDDLHASLEGGEHRVHAWCRSQSAVIVDLTRDEAAFANFNRWIDFEQGLTSSPTAR